MSVVNPSEKIVFHIDDEPLTRKLVKTVLEGSGYTVMSFEEPNLMLKNLLGVKPTAILMDVNMPRIDGYGLCQTVRRDFPDMKAPIIFLTGNKTPDDIRLAKQSGGDYFVVKPFTPESLINGIGKAFQARARDRARQA